LANRGAEGIQGRSNSHQFPRTHHEEMENYEYEDVKHRKKETRN